MSEWLLNHTHSKAKYAESDRNMNKAKIDWAISVYQAQVLNLSYTPKAQEGSVSSIERGDKAHQFYLTGLSSEEQ